MTSNYNIIHESIIVRDIRFNITVTERPDTSNESMRWIAKIDHAMEYAYGSTADSALRALENKTRKTLSIFFE